MQPTSSTADSQHASTPTARQQAEADRRRRLALFQAIDAAAGDQIIDDTGRYLVKGTRQDDETRRIVRAARPAQALARVLAEEGYTADQVRLLQATHYDGRTSVIIVQAAASAWTCLSANSEVARTEAARIDPAR